MDFVGTRIKIALIKAIIIFVTNDKWKERELERKRGKMGWGVILSSYGLVGINQTCLSEG